MKKLLLVLIASFLLSGCLTQEKETKNDDNNAPSETNNNEENNAQNEQNSEEGSENTDENEQKEEQLKTKIVSFYNGGFTNSTLNQESSQKQFVDWFNKDDELLTSIEYSGFAQMNYIGNEKDSWRFSTLTLGSQKSTGSIKFNFSQKIKSIKLNIQGYCKYIEYTDSYSVDKNSKFYLDGDLYDLSVESEATEELEKKDITKEYNPEVTSITISNEDGRVFVHSMELTY